jgi:hypothetical protein
MADDYSPIVEDLLRRIDKLEKNVAELNLHQHVYRPAHEWEEGKAPHTTRPVGFGGRR